MKSKCDYLINLCEQSAKYSTAINNEKIYTSSQVDKQSLSGGYESMKKNSVEEEEDEDEKKGKTTNTVLFYHTFTTLYTHSQPHTDTRHRL